MSRVLVTGGTGFIGAALVRRLVGDGVSVRVLDNGSKGSDARWLLSRMPTCNITQANIQIF